jgi:hypothetical protein
MAASPAPPAAATIGSPTIAKAPNPKTQSAAITDVTL